MKLTNGGQSTQIPSVHMAMFRPFHILRSHDVNAAAEANHDAVSNVTFWSRQLSRNKRPKGAFG